MPEFVAPGVYIEELEQGPRPIEGVPTSTAGFLGETERGPTRPRLVTSLNDYRRWFGGVFADGRYMPHAVSGFFENGGKRLYVCRIVGCGATTASRVFGDFTVTAAGPGAWGRRVWVRIQDGSTKSGFRLRLAYWSRVADDFRPYDPFETINKDRLPRPQHQEDFDDLSTDPSSPDFFEKRSVDSAGQLLSALGTIARTAGSDSQPSPTAETGEFLDEGGADDPQRPARTTSPATRWAAGWSSRGCSRWSSMRVVTSRSSMLRTRPTTARPSSEGSSITASGTGSVSP